MFKASNSVRLFLFMLAVLMMAGIWLTGFSEVHWFTYVVPAFLVFAAASGLCPGLFISRKILGIVGVKE